MNNTKITTKMNELGQTNCCSPLSQNIKPNKLFHKCQFMENENDQKNRDKYTDCYHIAFESTFKSVHKTSSKTL